MTERERLNELLKSCGYIDEQFSERLADFLLENGVILLPYKIGDKVYKIFELIKPTWNGNSCAGHESIINVVESKLELSDISIRGVYLTREEAEKYAKLPARMRDYHKISI
nr:MAG TPA: hypothetical protein [Caudoviricetes sp.]